MLNVLLYIQCRHAYLGSWQGKAFQMKNMPFKLSIIMTLGLHSFPYLFFSLSSIGDGKVGLILAFVEVSMGRRNASGS